MVKISVIFFLGPWSHEPRLYVLTALMTLLGDVFHWIPMAVEYRMNGEAVENQWNMWDVRFTISKINPLQLAKWWIYESMMKSPGYVMLWVFRINLPFFDPDRSSTRHRFWVKPSTLAPATLVKRLWSADEVVWWAYTNTYGNTYVYKFICLYHVHM